MYSLKYVYWVILSYTKKVCVFMEKVRFYEKISIKMMTKSILSQ